MCPGLVKIKMEQIKKVKEVLMDENLKSVPKNISLDLICRIDFNSLTLENIEEMLPVNNHDFYLSRIYSIFRKIDSNPEDLSAWEEAENKIEAQIEKTVRHIDRYESDEETGVMPWIQTVLIEGFQLFYEGLLCFADFLSTGDTEFILDSMELIYRGDLKILQFEREMEKNLEQSALICVA